MYKSIVFDLGGVMVDFAPRAYLVDRICNEEIEEQVYDLTFGSEEWKQLDAGLVSRFDGNQAMLRNAKAAGREFEVQGVLDDWLHILRPRRRMQELVRHLIPINDNCFRPLKMPIGTGYRKSLQFIYRHYFL